MTRDPRRARRNLTSVRVPKYRLHRPTGQAVVTLAQRDHYLGAHGSEASKAEYQRLVAQWLASGAPREAAPTAEALTIAQLVAAWQADVARRIEARFPGHEGRRRRALDRELLPLATLERLFGPTPAARFGPKDLKLVRKAMLESGTLCRWTVNARVQMLRRMFRWGVSEELLPPAQAHALDSLEALGRGDQGAREGRRVEPVAREHVEAVLPHVSRQVAAMIELQWWTGMRSGEVVSMRACDLDRSGKAWCYRPEHHKTEHHGRTREIWIGEHGQQVLLPFVNRVPLPEPEQPLFSAREADAERRREQSQRRVTPLWPSHRRRNASVRKADPRRVPGPSYDVPSYRRAIARGVDLANCALIRAALEGVLEKAGPGTSSSDPTRVLGKLTPRKLLSSEGKVHLDEARLERIIRRLAPRADVVALLEAARAATGRLEFVPRWHPHQLRHSCATRLRREQGLEAARVVLGHTSPAVTTHYAEVDAEKARLVMERLG